MCHTIFIKIYLLKHVLQIATSMSCEITANKWIWFCLKWLPNLSRIINAYNDYSICIKLCRGTALDLLYFSYCLTALCPLDPGCRLTVTLYRTLSIENGWIIHIYLLLIIKHTMCHFVYRWAGERDHCCLLVVECNYQDRLTFCRVYSGQQSRESSYLGPVIIGLCIIGTWPWW